MNNELIQIDNPLSWDELLLRWRDKIVDGDLMGTAENLRSLIEEDEIAAYKKEKKLPRNGRMVFLCSRIDFSDCEECPQEKIYFDEIEIAKYELNFLEEFQPSIEDVCARFEVDKDDLLRSIYSFSKEEFKRGFSCYTRVNGEAIKFYFDGDPKLRIANLEVALRGEQDKNKKLSEKVAELETNEQSPEDYALFSALPTNIKTVLEMLREGKTDKEVAQALYRNQAGLSQAQVGALLFRGKEFPAQSTAKGCGAELLGDDKKSTVTD